MNYKFSDNCICMCLCRMSASRVECIGAKHLKSETVKLVADTEYSSVAFLSYIEV
jgi:hypothetical protein